MSEITHELVRELFDYRDGNLYWRVAKANCLKIGDLAGFTRKDGYRQISINKKHYLTHRLIFLYHHGYLPKELDHIDGNSLNNHIENLRVVTHPQNCMNQKKTKTYNGKATSSLYIGVSWFNHNNKWGAHIKINGKLKHLGLFISETGAARAYNEAAIEEYGEYAMLKDIQ